MSSARVHICPPQKLLVPLAMELCLHLAEDLEKPQEEMGHLLRSCCGLLPHAYGEPEMTAMHRSSSDTGSSSDVQGLWPCRERSPCTEAAAKHGPCTYGQRIKAAASPLPSI